MRRLLRAMAAGVMGEGVTTAQKIISLLGSDLIRLWMLNDAPGSTVVKDYSSYAKNGTAAAVSFDGNTGGFDGSTSKIDISSDINTHLNTAEGTLVISTKVNSASVWTDGATRYIFFMSVDGSNEIRLNKNAVDNTLSFVYRAGGVNKYADQDGFSSTDTVQYAITWSKAADEVKFYVNGVQVNDTKTGLGTWSGAISSAFLGARTSNPNDVFNGFLSRAILCNTALSAAKLGQLALINP